ncbi:MAG: carbohydrate ABC transporter permease [Actinobacteria bacterium]|nr:carbohydrate ABC transporter permease [Actinomycetota bacterium]
MAIKSKNTGIISQMVLIVLIILVLIPVAYMFLIALTPHREMFVKFFPSMITFVNFVDVLLDKVEMRYYLNSWVVSIFTAVLTVILASLSAYGLSRYSFKARNWFIIIALLTQMLPMEVLAISYFRIIQKMGLFNTLTALILVDTTITVPFVILMLKSIFDAIPKEIEDAAMIDGCSRFSSFFRIILPLNWGGIFAAFIFAFLQAYSEFLYALTFTSDYRAQTVTVEISRFIGQYLTQWERMMATAALFSIPILLIFAFTQRIFLKGLIAGAVKE